MTDMNPSGRSGSSVMPIVAIGAVVAAVVSGVRFYGELNGWTYPLLGKNLFSTEVGGGGSILGVATLVPLFGFWFGRRLAADGRAPSSLLRSFFLHIVGVAVCVGVMWATMEGGFLEGWEQKSHAFAAASIVAGLFALLAWPASWIVNAAFGILTRVPIVLIQYVAIHKGWDTHYSKAHPDLPSDPETMVYALTLVQISFWPLAFTTLVGGIFATLGAATARRA